MTITDHPCVINAVHVAEIHIKVDPLGAPVMEATYATAQKEKSGMVATHGRCSAYPSNWSEETMHLLEALHASMERDLIPRHFKMEAGLKEETDAREGLESGGLEEADQI